MTRTDILTQALEARDAELLSYQINIDNYRLAIAKIQAEHPDNQDLAAFREELEIRLAEELRQQLRARIIRDVIADQLQDP
jgi:hypothetical protein